MTQKEKAKIKAYNNAIEKAKEYLNSPRTCFDIEQLYNIFPELRKSEDNMIKEELIKHLKDGVEGYMPAGGSEDYARWLAWVEKQGKPIDINPSEFDLCLNKLLKRFESLPKEEITNSLNFYLNVVQNDGTYMVDKKQYEQQPIIEMKSAEESLGISSEEYNDIVNECLYGESESSDKVELKFKVGDWITNGDYTWKIIEVKPLDYILQSQDGNIVDDTISHVDEQFHSFTIKDAKDGDVLCVKYGNDEMPFIFTGKQDDVAYCALNSFGEFVLSIAEWLLKISVLPATKEQHDTLFAKMKEAGYEWNAEKKELKKINTYCQNNCKGFQEIGKCFADGDCEAKKNVLKNKSYDDELLESAIAFIESSNKFCEWKGNSKKDVLDWIDSLKHRVQQKQEWTEEDIRNIENIDSVLFYDKDLPEETCMRLRNWLQSLKPNKDMIEALRTEYEKGRADTLSEMKSSWSEEDEDAIGMAIIALEDMYDEDTPNTTYGGYNLPFNKAAERLKSLKDRVQPQPKQEWSEEDEEYINDLIGVFDGQQYQAHSDEEVVNWLKSIRLQCNKEWGESDEEMLKSIIATCELACEDRDSSPARHLLKMQTNWLKSLRPQKQWKPSNEQIEALENLVRSYGESGTLSPYDNNTKQLYSLLYDLKNLNN